MTAESCESCGVVAELHTVSTDDDIEPFRVCARCRPVWRPQRLPFPSDDLAELRRGYAKRVGLPPLRGAE